MNNISTLISSDLLKNLNSYISPKAFGDQLLDSSKQKIIQTQSILSDLLKEKTKLIEEEIQLEIEHSNNIQKLNNTKNSTNISEEEFNNNILREEENYKNQKINIQVRKNKNQNDIDNLLKDPFKKQKDELNKRKETIKKAKENNKKNKKKSINNKRKMVLNNAKKTLFPILTTLLTDKIIQIISQNDIILKLIDDTNNLIKEANSSNNKNKLDNAKLVRDNTIRVIQNNENKIKQLINQINIINQYITLFNTIISIISSIPVPTGIGVPISLIMKLVKLLDRANKIVLALNSLLPIIINSLEKEVSILEEYKSRLININGIIDIGASPLNINFGTNFEKYKGFKFALKEENNNKFNVKGNKRHYAVAINERGIEILKSEYSFTLDPNDLIEQLKLKIDSLNLSSS